MYVGQHKLMNRIEHGVLVEGNEAANRPPTHSERLLEEQDKGLSPNIVGRLKGAMAEELLLWSRRHLLVDKRSQTLVR
jgi:hypothetical protein